VIIYQVKKGKERLIDILMSNSSVNSLLGFQQGVSEQKLIPDDALKGPIFNF